MNKKDLVAKISEEQNVSKARAQEVVDAVFEAIIEELKNGEKVTIANFGNFYVKQKKQRVSVIPNTTKRVLIPSYKTAGFRPAKSFKEDVK